MHILNISRFCKVLSENVGEFIGNKNLSLLRANFCEEKFKEGFSRFSIQ